MALEKIQKVLANLGLGSRREIERWIVMGRISVNGEIAKLGDRIAPHDHVSFDKKAVLLKTPSKARMILYHKPVGEVSTRKDEKQRPTVFDHLPPLQKGRWIMIGRLDLNTSGLLLFTNDGNMAHCLMHPSYEIEREYAVRLLGKIPPPNLAQLKKGVLLEEGMAKFEDIVPMKSAGHNHWYRVVLKEGRNREVRRLFESQGLSVNRLIRIRFGHITLPLNLKKGQWKELTMAQIEGLWQLIEKQ